MKYLIMAATLILINCTISETSGGGEEIVYPEEDYWYFRTDSARVDWEDRELPMCDRWYINSKDSSIHDSIPCE